MSFNCPVWQLEFSLPTVIYTLLNITRGQCWYWGVIYLSYLITNDWIQFVGWEVCHSTWSSSLWRNSVILNDVKKTRAATNNRDSENDKGNNTISWSSNCVVKHLLRQIKFYRDTEDMQLNRLSWGEYSLQWRTLQKCCKTGKNKSQADVFNSPFFFFLVSLSKHVWWLFCLWDQKTFLTSLSIPAAVQDEFSWMWHLGWARKLNVPLISDEFSHRRAVMTQPMDADSSGDVTTGSFESSKKRLDSMMLIHTLEQFHTH